MKISHRGSSIFRSTQKNYVTTLPLSALCAANEVAVAIEAGPTGEIPFEFGGIGAEQVGGGYGVLRVVEIMLARKRPVVEPEMRMRDVVFNRFLWSPNHGPPASAWCPMPSRSPWTPLI